MDKTKICDICNKKITEKEFKNNDGYCHECFTKKQTEVKKNVYINRDNSL